MEFAPFGIVLVVTYVLVVIAIIALPIFCFARCASAAPSSIGSNAA